MSPGASSFSGSWDEVSGSHQPSLKSPVGLRLIKPSCHQSSRPEQPLQSPGQVVAEPLSSLRQEMGESIALGAVETVVLWESGPRSMKGSFAALKPSWATSNRLSFPDFSPAPSLQNRRYPSASAGSTPWPSRRPITWQGVAAGASCSARPPSFRCVLEIDWWMAYYRYHGVYRKGNTLNK